MTVTIASRWRVSFRVYSLARVSMPVTAPRVTRKDNGPDLLALVQAQQLKQEMAAMRHRWETDALLSAQRMFR